MKRKQKTDEWQAFRDVGNPLVNAAINRILKRQEAGLAKRPPRSENGIRSLEDLCRYSFKKMRLDGSYQVKFIGDHIDTWVWCGADYTDKNVGLIERVVGHVGDVEFLKELRLVETGVSPAGIKRLRSVLFSTNVNVIALDEAEKNSDWSQAHYHGQNDDKWKNEAFQQNEERPPMSPF